jgi:hypothetical protein
MAISDVKGQKMLTLPAQESTSNGHVTSVIIQSPVVQVRSEIKSWNDMFYAKNIFVKY